MNGLYIFIVILILFFVVNYQIDFSLEYDILKNEGVFKVKIFKHILIIKGIFNIQENFIKIKRKKNKWISINLKLTKKQLRFFKELNKNIVTKIFLKKINVNTILCLEDPFISAIFSGVYGIISNILCIKLKQNNYDATIINDVNTGFRQNNIKIELNLVIIASIFDLLWALVITIINERRRNEETRRKTEY